MTLPLLISVPHVRLRVPPEVERYCTLGPQEILEDGDVGADRIYRGLKAHVVAFVTTDIARAIVDINRAVHDRGKDGIVKTHTCWDVPVYREPLPEEIVSDLLDRYYHPYHGELTRLAATSVTLGVDCHTMAAHAPPVAPDAGKERPAVCLGDLEGTSCPARWTGTGLLAECLEETFGRPVRVNDPFRGGYVVRAHHEELPWVQLELSRAPFLDDSEKGQRVHAALRLWCERSGAARSDRV